MTKHPAALRRIAAAVILLAGSAVLAGCAGSSGTATPTLVSPSPAAVPITTPAQAIAQVIRREPRLTGIAPRDPDAIGQASWYEVAPASGVGAFVVTVRIGWGDCESGCMSEHRWVLAVAPDGTVSVVSEAGPPVPEEAWPGRAPRPDSGIVGTVTSGPVCPVEKVPPDPACAPRPVAGAVILIRDASGATVFRVTTGADGSFVAAVGPGRYVVAAQPVQGLMGTPAPVDVTVAAGAISTVPLVYDTGIR